MKFKWTLILGLTILIPLACQQSSSAKKKDPIQKIPDDVIDDDDDKVDDDDGSDTHGEADANPRDEFGAQFMVDSHTSSKSYGDCDGEFEDARINRIEGRIAFYQLLANQLVDKDLYHLYMYSCESEDDCSIPFSFMSFEKREGDTWGGTMGGGVSDDVFEDGKCNFWYNWYTAKLTGDDLLILKEMYNKSVDPIDGECEDSHKFMEKHFQKDVECVSRSRIEATKVSDKLPPL